MTPKNNALRKPLIVGLALTCLVLSSVVEIHACFRKPVVPDWVNFQLSDPDYFIGIGSAPIIKKQNTHIERARRDALNELASAISVQVFSSNVLVTLVRNDIIKDEFNSLIRSRVTSDIEGYELVDSYADKKNYWVFYRLSKQKYYEQQRQKRLAATQNALSNYQLATRAEQQGDLKNALVNYAKTIDAVKLYLNENIIAEVDGMATNLVVKAFAGLTHILSTLRIHPQHSQVDVVFSEEINPDMLTFRLQDAAGKGVAGFPLLGYYSERAMQQPVRVTDAKGSVKFSVGKVRSSKQKETFRVAPDISSILLESSTDFTVRKAILEMPFQTVSVPVHIRKPSIRFQIDAKMNNTTLTESMLVNTFNTLSLQSGYGKGGPESDYICYIETDTRQQSFNNGIYTSVLTGNIVLADKQNNIRYTTQIDPVKGMQLSPEKAGLEAYNVLQQQIATRYFREIEEAISK